MFLIKAIKLLCIYLISIALISCGGGGIEGSGLKGTVSTNVPLKNKTIHVRGRDGRTAKTTTGENGRYKVNVENLVPPYLLKTTTDEGVDLYSLALNQGVANIHPLTDLVSRNFFVGTSENIESEFDSTKELKTIPTEEEINAILNAIEKLFVAAYEIHSISPEFNFLTSEFDTNKSAFYSLLQQLELTLKDGKAEGGLNDEQTNISVYISIDININFGSEQDDTPPPPVISNIGLEVISSSQIDLTWVPPLDEGIQGYNIYFKTESEYSIIATVIASEYKSKKLHENTRYCYKVKSFNKALKYSDFSEEICVTTLGLGESPNNDITPPSTTAEPGGRTFSSVQNVILTCADDSASGCVIYYTTNGSAPTGASNKYVNPIVISSDTVLSFFARDQAGNPEEIKTETYNFEVVDIIAPVTSINVSGGAFNSTQNITLECSDATGGGCTEIYYTTNGTAPTVDSAKYNLSITVSKNMTLKYFSVDIAGNSENIHSEKYIIDAVLPTSSVDIGSGSYFLTQAINLRCEDDNPDCDTFYYTLDGNDPTTSSTKSTGSVIVTSDAVLKFFAVDKAGNEGAINTENYTIKNPLVVGVTVSHSPVVAGQRAMYTMTIANTSTVPVYNVYAKFLVPSELMFSQDENSMPDVVCSDATCDPEEEAYWNVGTLNPGENITISVDALVSADVSDGASIIVPFNFGADRIQGGIDFIKTVPVFNSPAAEIALSASASRVVANDLITYSIDFGNISNSDLTNAQLQATFPSGITILTSSGGTDSGSGEITWDLAAVSGVSDTFRHIVIVQVNDNVNSGEILRVKASLAYDGGLEIDNIAEHSVAVVANKAPLNVSINASPNPVIAGGRLLYTITLINESYLPITGVYASFRVPGELSFDGAENANPNASCGSSNCEAKWDIGTLASGESSTITIDALVSSSAISGSLITVPMNFGADKIHGSINVFNTLPVFNASAAELTLTSSVDQVLIDETFIYTIDLGNVSNSALTNITLDAFLPLGITVLDTGGGSEIESGIITWDVASLAVNETLRREVTVISDGAYAGELMNAEVFMYYDGGLVLSNTAKRDTAVIANTMPFSVSVNVSSDPVIAGARLLYTITLTNDSSSTINGLHALFRVPAELSFSETDVSPAVSCSDVYCDPIEEVKWDIGTLVAGESSTITVNALVNTNADSGSLISVPLSFGAAEFQETIDLIKVTPVTP